MDAPDQMLQLSVLLPLLQRAIRTLAGLLAGGSFPDAERLAWKARLLTRQIRCFKAQQE